MKKLSMITFLFLFFIGCAYIPVRPALEEDTTIPPGEVEGNRFTGIRYHFTVSAPPTWKLTTEFPDFMEKLGYDRPFSTDKEQTEVYAYNPATKSTMTFDFTPAGRHARFSQKHIEWLTASVTKTIESDLEKERGKGVANVSFGPTEALSLRGVQYAAKKFVTYTVKGAKREQGWIYGFTEPYQIFILYMILEKEGVNDRQDLKQILDSFEAIRKK